MINSADFDQGQSWFGPTLITKANLSKNFCSETSRKTGVDLLGHIISIILLKTLIGGPRDRVGKVAVFQRS